MYYNILKLLKNLKFYNWYTGFKMFEQYYKVNQAL